MTFIMEFMSVASEDLEEGAALFERYYEYLDGVKEKMPQEAYSFAVADWHYDHADPRCPHHELIPVWPHERFAAACAVGKWDGYDPRPIELSTWMNRWLPEMRREKRLVSVFPVCSADDRGIVVSPKRFREDLEAELDLVG